MAEDAKRLRLELRQKKRECRALRADLQLMDSYAHVERERRMSLEFHLGRKFFCFFLHQILGPNINLQSSFFIIQIPTNG